MGNKIVTNSILSEFWKRAKNWITDKITEIVTKRIAEIVDDAPDELNTFGEVAKWIAEHNKEAKTMSNTISANTAAIAEKANVTHTHTHRYYRFPKKLTCF